MLTGNLLWVTALTTSVLGGLYVRLALAVVKIRRREKISIGSSENDALARAIRIHSNFSEYVPISVILLALLEIHQGPKLLLVVLGLAMILGRVFHSFGLVDDSVGSLKKRTLGMQLTLWTIIALCVFNVLAVLFQVGGRM